MEFCILLNAVDQCIGEVLSNDQYCDCEGLHQLVANLGFIFDKQHGYKVLTWSRAVLVGAFKKSGLALTASSMVMIALLFTGAKLDVLRAGARQEGGEG
jgi:hypothetical protein